MSRVPVLAVALAFAVACQAMPPAATPLPTGAITGGTVRVAMPAEVTTLDPWLADAASVLATRQLYETLVTVDAATSAIAPELAESWQPANDGATWIFRLREGVRFHDGTPLDAAAVVASFERGRGTRAYRQLFEEPGVIERVVSVDARTVRFDLRAAFGPFVAHLAAPQAGIARGAAGTGPFAATPDGLAPDGTLTLRRNDAYWRRDAAGRALPYLDGLVLRPVRDPGSRLAELRGGRAEVAIDLPVAQAAAARSDPSLTLAVRRDAAVASVGMDTSAPPFDRLDVRRAIALAIDRNPLSAVYSGLSRPASQIVSSGTLGHDDSVVEFSALDVAAARKVLADARIPTPINVELVYPSAPTAAYPDPQRIAQSVSADLGKIGIVARLRAVDPPSVADSRAALTLDTTLAGLDPDDTFWALHGARAGDAREAGSLIVGLLRTARTESDPTKRAELYKQVSKIARTDAIRVPLVFADRPAATSARVVGLGTVGGMEYFGTVWLRP